MKRRLTDALLQSLAEKGGAPVIWDSAVSGFGVRTGKRTVSYFAIAPILDKPGGSAVVFMFLCGA